MDTKRNTIAWQERLLVSVQTSLQDLDEMVEDVEAITPVTTRTCPEADTAIDSVVHVSFEFADDPALLDRVVSAIFRTQSDLDPKVTVRRLLSDRSKVVPGGRAACPSRAADNSDWAVGDAAAA
jgi:hypothetical protein